LIAGCSSLAASWTFILDTAAMAILLPVSNESYVASNLKVSTNATYSATLS